MKFSASSLVGSISMEFHEDKMQKLTVSLSSNVNFLHP